MRLQAARLLDRRTDPAGRPMLLCLTPVGSEVIRRLREVLAGHLERVISQQLAGQPEALAAGIALSMTAPSANSRSLPVDAHLLFRELARRAPAHRLARA